MDSSHLEKMGRELKCPICLSLLNSAVSLTCNHVFCNLCIEKSMKSASNCPVCKVPYRRREVRPAPHMDNLVSIYKSMEVASGVNIFVTQTVPSNKLSGGENQPEADMVCENGKTSSGTADLRNKRELKRNSPKGSSKKPSFPTKKRVQVPQNPLPETPTQPAKHEVSLGEVTTTGPQRSSVIRKDMPVLEKKEELEFCPFFWLRDEEDADKPSQPTDVDHVMDTPPVVPCFSDIKDSDDEFQCNMTPEKGLSTASHNAADLFDSEMFEWTQRACSPELCSSPMKMQVEETDRYEVNLEDKAGSKHKAKNMEHEPDKMMEDLATSACPGTIHFGNEGRTTRPNKRCKKASQSNQNKRAKKTKGTCIDSKDVAEENIQEGKLDTGNPGNASNLKGKPNKKVKKVCRDPSATETMRKNDSTLAEGEKSLNQGRKPMLLVDLAVSLDDKYGISKGQNTKKASKSNQNKRERGTKGICIDLKEASEDSIRDEELDNIGHAGNASNLKVKPNKRVKKVCLGPCVTRSMPGNVSALAEGAKPQNQGNRPMLLVDLSGSLDEREGISGNQNLKNTGKNSKTIAQQQIDCSRRLKPQKLNTAPNIILQNQSNNGLISNSRKSCTRGCDYKVSDLGAEGKDNDIVSMMDSTRGKKLKPLKKVTFFAADNSKVASANDSKSIYSSAKEAQSIIKLQGSSDVSSKMEKNHSSLNGILRKCETTPKKIRCSFCQCMEDSEASGVMVHYLNGKPVTVDYDGGENVTHVHRNCAEWAPNVYFEDDNAINLEAELTRSKRIKCGCCGLKGAALGCYEKSCRRSFHVPCAKLTPQCRWDYDNFVMLCPLHASLKLPNEVSGSHKKQKAKCLPRRQPPPKVVVKNDNNSSWNSNGLSGKLVLCCSALTVAEKETVTEFERLSGVTVLKNWDSSVTHVVASTDENGACRRTLKFLMGILEGKWILSIEWVKACLKAMENVDEQCYEIDVDIHGIRDGPRNGRLRLLNKQPKLFDGYKFYFTGDYQPSYKGYLHDLVIAAGGTVLQRKPISGDNEAPSSTFIIYSLELPDKCKPSKRNIIVNRRRSNAESLATSCQGLVATNSWILNSIAACKLQSFA